MKTTHSLLSKLNAIQQSNWIRPVLMMLAILVAVLGVAGCHTDH
jgi:hypothetical protein